jgi:hypothetical protein
MKMASEGFVHYHELVNAKTGDEHPTVVAWFKHTAVAAFTLDKAPMPNVIPHKVTPGIDSGFLPNYMTPYKAKTAAEVQQEGQQMKMTTATNLANSSQY